MNRRLITIFLVAIVIASACCWLVYRIVNVKMSTAKPLSTTQVIAASKDIPLGAVLTTADLTTMTLTGTPPKGALVKQEDAVGRGVITNIPQGEPILDSQLASLGSGGGLAPTIPQGMRACAVAGDARGRTCLGQSSGRRPERRCSHGDDSAEHPGSLRGHRHSEGPGRQAASSTGREPAGDAGASRAAEPGGEFAEDSAGAAQSA